MPKFLNYTLGLMAAHSSKPQGAPLLVRVAYYALPAGDIRLQAESGHNLSAIPHAKTITRDVFDNRATDTYDGVVEARWALAELGFSIDP